jgi:hypothetical protein
MEEEATLLSVSTLCHRWGLSKQAIYNMINSGELEARNLNADLQRDGLRQRAQWRVRADEAERWERQQGGRR